MFVIIVYFAGENDYFRIFTGFSEDFLMRNGMHQLEVLRSNKMTHRNAEQIKFCSSPLLSTCNNVIHDLICESRWSHTPSNVPRIPEFSQARNMPSASQCQRNLNSFHASHCDRMSKEYQQPPAFIEVVFEFMNICHLIDSWIIAMGYLYSCPIMA